MNGQAWMSEKPSSDLQAFYGYEFLQVAISTWHEKTRKKKISPYLIYMWYLCRKTSLHNNPQSRMRSAATFQCSGT